MRQISSFFRGKTKPAFLILSVYLLLILILHTSLNYNAITRLFWIFMGIAALFLAFLLLYCGRSLCNFKFITTSRQVTRKERLCIACIFPVTAALFLFSYVSKATADVAVLFQILCFCATFTCLAYVLYQNGCSAFFLLALCLYLCLYLRINPQFTEQISSQDGGAVLMVFTVILTTCYIQIICTGCQWLHSRLHILLFVLAAIFSCCTVWYSVFFTVPLILVTMIYTVRKRQKRLLSMLSLLVMAILAGSFFLYPISGKSSGRLSDNMELPLSIWCNVMQTYPSALPTETQEFMYSIIPQEVYDEYTLNSGFQSISSSDLIHYETIDSLSILNVMAYTWQCFRYAPKESLEAFAFTTRNVWEISISTYGMELLAMLVIGVILLSGNRSSIFHLLPLFCYNFGSVLLTGGTQTSLFLLNIPLWPAVIFLMLADRTEFRLSHT